MAVGYAVAEKRDGSVRAIDCGDVDQRVRLCGLGRTAGIFRAGEVVAACDPVLRFLFGEDAGIEDAAFCILDGDDSAAALIERGEECWTRSARVVEETTRR